jgi:carbonic anhydrase
LNPDSSFALSPGVERLDALTDNRFRETSRQLLTPANAMSSIDKVLKANKLFAIDYDPNVISPRPQQRLAVLTCMDTRISRKALGLAPGDAHLIRNAGGIVTDDAIRSLLISHYLLGTQEFMIINHTDCGLMKATEEELQQTIERRAGLPANSPVRFHAFSDVERNVREQLLRLTAHSWVREEVIRIRGFVFDVQNGALREVVI